MSEVEDQVFNLHFDFDSYKSFSSREKLPTVKLNAFLCVTYDLYR